MHAIVYISTISQGIPYILYVISPYTLLHASSSYAAPPYALYVIPIDSYNYTNQNLLLPDLSLLQIKVTACYAKCLYGLFYKSLSIETISCFYSLSVVSTPLCMTPYYSPLRSMGILFPYCGNLSPLSPHSPLYLIYFFSI